MNYFAHIDNKNNNIDIDKKQTVKEHNENVANVAKKLCSYPSLKNTAYLCGLLHDIGKSCKYFQNYLKNQIYGDKSKSKKSHSTSGAKYINDKFHNSNDYFKKLTSELISIAISSHHGLFDCVNIDGENKFEERMNNKMSSDNIPQNQEELEGALKNNLKMKIFQLKICLINLQ